MVRTLFLCSSLALAMQTSAAHRLTLSHDKDPGSFIAVDVSEGESGKLYAFSLCSQAHSTSCNRIGRREHYREQDLLALLQSYSTSGKAVLIGELMVIAATVSALVFYFRSPTLAAGVHSTIARAASQPTLHAPQPHLDGMSYGAKLLAWGYANLVGPAMGIAFWNIKDEFFSRFQTLVCLCIRFLSPSEHLRAATLLTDLTRSVGNLHFSERDFASIGEFFFQYPVDNLQHLKLRIENILIVMPH